MSPTLAAVPGTERADGAAIRPANTTPADLAPILLEATDLSVSYGRVEALHRVSLRIRAGQIVTVIGPNGAGKTTLLAALMGLLPSAGAIGYLGQVRGAGDSVETLVDRGLVLVPEKRELFAQMSVQDNLLLGAFCRYRRGLRDQAQTMEQVYATFPRLQERRTQLAGSLSGGERQMLAMGRALMAKPTLLMLDEPSLGLAPLIIREIFRIVSGLRALGVAVLLVEQNARAALQVSDYGYVLESGELALEGPSGQLADDRRVIESYLGLGGKTRAEAQPIPQS
jgi:branched-chain amino acid transport system ATP-binding protein